MTSGISIAASGEDDVGALMHGIGVRARAAGRVLSTASPAQKDAALLAGARAIRARAAEILAANAADLAEAVARGTKGSFLDRLTMSPERLEAMAAGVEAIAALDDPVGTVIAAWTQPNGLKFERVRVPLGVVGVIFESRPNVTADAGALCLKAGNAVILRGGSESFHSNLAIAGALQAGGASRGLPADAVQLIPTTDREAVKLMAEMDKYLDLIVPRGGQSLIETVVSHARMPVIKHYHGVCHVYVDDRADLKMAANIVLNAKAQRPGVCNSLETLLIHRDIAEGFLSLAAPAFAKAGLAIHADPAGHDILSRLGYQSLHQATEANWTTEYLDLVMSLRIVENLDEAIEHIERYGSHHSDAIVTKDADTAERFLNQVDSATVYWNASTRFTDGGQFGFGAEIGISTDKLHARGPMGLEELTTYKYQIRGEGQIRE
jgi:glutamate-5-semialdehyde dehydrogenase